MQGHLQQPAISPLQVAYRQLNHSYVGQSPTPGQKATTCIKLPAYEDFVEGTLQFGDETIRTYYEHSLSYLVLMSDSANTLRKIADRLAPLMQIA